MCPLHMHTFASKKAKGDSETLQGQPQTEASSSSDLPNGSSSAVASSSNFEEILAEVHDHFSGIHGELDFECTLLVISD